MSCHAGWQVPLNSYYTLVLLRFPHSDAGVTEGTLKPLDSRSQVKIQEIKLGLPTAQRRRGRSDAANSLLGLAGVPATSIAPGRQSDQFLAGSFLSTGCRLSISARDGFWAEAFHSAGNASRGESTSPDERGLGYRRAVATLLARR